MCYDYTARDQLTCDQIAKAYNFSVADIESFNKDTWGWKGCGAIQEGSRMCLSSGLPPMPVAREGYVCGPQKPGTLPPLEWSQLSSLNPCPSGQCVSHSLISTQRTSTDQISSALKTVNVALVRTSVVHPHHLLSRSRSAAQKRHRLRVKPPLASHLRLRLPQPPPHTLPARSLSPPHHQLPRRVTNLTRGRSTFSISH